MSSIPHCSLATPPLPPKPKCTSRGVTMFWQHDATRFYVRTPTKSHTIQLQPPHLRHKQVVAHQHISVTLQHNDDQHLHHGCQTPNTTSHHHGGYQCQHQLSDNNPIHLTSTFLTHLQLHDPVAEFLQKHNWEYTGHQKFANGNTIASHCDYIMIPTLQTCDQYTYYSPYLQ